MRWLRLSCTAFAGCKVKAIARYIPLHLSRLVHGRVRGSS